MAQNLFVTAEEIILGYALGAGAGVALGLLMGSYPVIASIFDPILMAVYGVPKIAFGPLFIVWFGINLDAQGGDHRAGGVLLRVPLDL